VNWKAVESVNWKAVETANWRAVEIVNWKAVEAGPDGFVDLELKYWS
jgi:hypothetical protein